MDQSPGEGERRMQTGKEKTLHHLEEAHRRLESELRALMGQGYLTPSDQTRLRDLKKQKLATKDKIQLCQR
jgi:hypothetical protein